MAIDYDKALGMPPWRVEQDFTHRDTIIYALAVGLGQDPTDERELTFLYEKRLAALPTYASTLAWKRLAEVDIGMTYTKMVHADQRMVLHRPPPVSGAVHTELRVKEIVDRGAEKGAVVYFERKLFEAGVADPVSTQTLGIMARADGGFGGPERSLLPIHNLPERAPDQVCKLPTSPRSALIYRLTGDVNPLHIDPETARKAGFDRPILHGLCTYGVCGFAVLKSVLNYDASRLLELDGRFSAPVLPGDLLEADIWVDGDEVSLRVRAPERNVVVFNNGRAKIKT